MKEKEISFEGEDLCIMCGAPVPEGAWVCRACEIGVCGKAREENSEIARALWGNESKVKTLDQYTERKRKDGN